MSVVPGNASPDGWGLGDPLPQPRQRWKRKSERRDSTEHRQDLVREHQSHGGGQPAAPSARSAHPLSWSQGSVTPGRPGLTQSLPAFLHLTPCVQLCRVWDPCRCPAVRGGMEVTSPACWASWDPRCTPTSLHLDHLLRAHHPSAHPLSRKADTLRPLSSGWETERQGLGTCLEVCPVRSW